MRWAGAAFAALLLASPAWPCSMAPVFQDGGRYVGGDLVTQIALRADTIQIVRAVHRMPIGVNADGRRIYAFQFEVVSTLSQRDRGPPPGGFSLDGYERIRSVRTPDGFRTMDEVEVWLPPDALDRPGTVDGYWQLRAPGPVHLNRGSCGWPMHVELGEEFVVLRQPNGRLYSFDSIGAEEREQDAELLRIEFTYRPGSRAIATSAGPPLVRIESPQDPFLARLRSALRGQGRLAQ